MLVVLYLLSLLYLVGAENKCLYEKCPAYKSDHLNVHLVCHTHDDMGWLQTAEQYYWGKGPTTNSGVQYILNTVVKALNEDPRRRFTYVETGFFRRWWRQQHDSYRHVVRKLVNDGQLEFANGGWVSHDEATTHYMGMIDQMTVGHRQLNLSFGDCAKPVTGWQIDPFGHSKENARLYARMGLDALFFARIQHNDRTKRLKERNMEFVWKTGDGNSDKDSLFTGVFPVHYMPPDGFCFDQFCGDVLIDDKRSAEYNMKTKIQDFIKKMHEQARDYKTNHVMLTMGGDFQYQNADHWYANLDKLVEAVNDGSARGEHNVTVSYSTPSCYVKGLNEYSTTWRTKTDDFFPYATTNHSYWTGYFSSRPTFKGFERQANGLLQTCKQFDAVVGLGPSDLGDIDVLKEAVALSQHHDAVSGTAKQHVTNDYAKQLYQGITECQQVLNDGLGKLANSDPANEVFCPLLNVSTCSVSTSQNEFTVRAFNGLSRLAKTHLRVPVGSGTYTVVDSRGQQVVFDMAKVAQTRQLAFVSGAAPYEILFPATIPALGYATYVVKKTGGRTPHRTRHHRDGDDLTLKNEFLKAEFGSDGKLKAVTDLSSGTRTAVAQDLMYYVASVKADQPSGAYIFRPNGTKPTAISGTVTARRLTGSNYEEVWQTFSDWATQVIRLYKGRPYLEFEWTVGPIPLQHKTKTMPSIGKEVISRFTTDIASNKRFYTDANGRQLVERVRNFQPEYQFEHTEPVAANYYPVNTRAFIKDAKMQMTVVTDRSQGGSSLSDGQLEFMVHRRLTVDDHFGVGEALNETGPRGQGLVARGVHRLLLSTVQKAAKLHRAAAEELFSRPVVTFGKGVSAAPKLYKGLSRELPLNVKVITLEQWHASTVLLRLEHTFQAGEDSELSKPVTINLKGLFGTFDITGATEMTLSANRRIDERKRFTWKTSEDLSPAQEEAVNLEAITLNPMDIRTFQCNIRRK